ncbi:pentapeptide repeat-containing protein, partial [Mycobacterium gordonae]|uniref:pentapeptide repeat-containing protein n=1 Tax=Mycobacterium gordonae TaxID=1778 RepID=UPI001E47B4EB
ANAGAGNFGFFDSGNFNAGSFNSGNSNTSFGNAGSAAKALGIMCRQKALS